MGDYVKALGARDLLGQHVVDFDERVDIARLRRERREKLQEQMAKEDLGGLILADSLNIRYATGIRYLAIQSLHMRMSNVIFPREGKPVFFGGQGVEPPIASGEIAHRPFNTTDFWTAGDHQEEANRRWARATKESLEELGIANERIGVDRLDTWGLLALLDERVKVVDAGKATSMARAIKTDDELALIRQATAIADVALWNVQQAIEPGVTENELFAVMASTNLSYGGEFQDCRFLSAGGNTNPWLLREASERIVRPGDLVAMDTDMAGPMGYFADISRTYLCGDGPPNEEQLDAYKRAYEFIQECLPMFKPGVTFQELAEGIPPTPDEYTVNKYPLIAHGVGMTDEWPAIYFVDAAKSGFAGSAATSGFGNYVGEFKENMVMTMEASFGREGGREQVKLEEQLIITKNGPDVISQAPYDWRFLD